MRCAEFQQRWQFLLDQRQLPQEDETLCAHAEICEDCSETLRVQTLLFREIDRAKRTRMRGQSGLPNRADPAMTRNAIPSRVVRHGSRPRRPLAKALFIGLAVAGSLFVVIVPAWRHSTTLNGVARHRANVPGSKQRSLPPVIWVAKTQSAANSKSSESAISQPKGIKPNGIATNQTTQFGITPEQEALRKLMQDMAARLSDVPEEQLEPLDRIAGGFRPLANTLGVAWDALRRTIPVGRSQAVQEPQAVLGWPGLQASPA